MAERMADQNAAADIAVKPKAGAGKRKGHEFTPREDTVGFLLWDARRAVSREFSRKLAQHGVSNGVFSVLRILWDEDSLTQSEIARRGRMTGPTIVGVVAQLESQKLVVRIPCPNDSRKRKIQLTDEGIRLRSVVLPLVEQMSAKAMAGFSDAEKQQLKDLLRRIRGNFANDDTDTADAN